MSGCNPKSARSYYNSGNKYFLSGNYEEAAQKYASAIMINSNKAQYYISYGLCLTALGQYEEAINQFEKAYLDKDIKIIRENNKRIHRGKGIAYYNMTNFEDAIEQFNNALAINELSSLDMDILNYKGSAQKIIGLYEEALEAYSTILANDVDNANAYFDRAYVYRKLGDYEKSLANYDRAIELKPIMFDYYFGKYFLMVEVQDKTIAKEVLDQASEITIKTKQDQYNLAKVHFFQGLYDLALSEFSEGFANGFYDSYYYIGEIYEIQKDYATAIYYYEKYIESGKNVSPFVYNKIGTCLMKMNEYKQALSYFEKGLEFQIPSDLKILHRNSIVAYENLGMFDVAYDNLKEYLERYPEDLEAQREEKFLRTRLN